MKDSKAVLKKIEETKNKLLKLREENGFNYIVFKNLLKLNHDHFSRPWYVKRFITKESFDIILKRLENSKKIHNEIMNKLTCKILKELPDDEPHMYSMSPLPQIFEKRKR